MATVLHLSGVDVDGERLPGHAHGGVLVPPDRRSWMVFVTTTRQIDLRVGEPHELRLETREGTTVSGQATLRRSDGQSHYFVGATLPPELIDA